MVYSLLRVNAPASPELWIRLGTGISFPEAAAQFGQGPEARHLGVIGPLALRDIHPELSRPVTPFATGEINPHALGGLVVLLRLEKLIPAVLIRARPAFDQGQLDEFLQDRQKRLLAGDPLDNLEYHPES